MSIISRPLTAALVAVLALFAVMMLVVRPQLLSHASRRPAAPQHSGPAKPQTPYGSAVQQARDARAQTEAAQRRSGGAPAPAVGAAGTKPVAPAAGSKVAPPVKPAAPRAATPAAAAPGGAGSASAQPSPASLRRALAQHRLLAILVYNPAATDDLAVKAALDQVPAHMRGVVTAAVPVAQISSYRAVSGDIRVLGTPTVLVFGRDGTLAGSVVGFMGEREIRQALLDASQPH